MSNKPAEKPFILVVEDSDDDYDMLRRAFEKDRLDNPHFRCRDGQEALDYLKEAGLSKNTDKPGKPALILLDLDMPGLHGLEVLRALRVWSGVPLIVLTGRIASEDTVTALDLGADDYLTKPFDANVLEARINAALRKSATRKADAPELTNGPLRMDLTRQEVFIDEKIVKFTPKEYDLLLYFMKHRGRMLTHESLLKDVWGDAPGEDARYLRVFISKIREKIAAVGKMAPLITTQAGVGYRMEEMGPGKEKMNPGKEKTNPGKAAAAQ